jgi:hypothetical protein
MIVMVRITHDSLRLEIEPVSCTFSVLVAREGAAASCQQGTDETTTFPQPYIIFFSIATVGVDSSMNLQGSEGSLLLETDHRPMETGDFAYSLLPDSPYAMLKQLSAVSEGFASGSTLLANAFGAHRQIIIAANMNSDAFSLPALSFWTCVCDEHGIDLIPFSLSPSIPFDLETNVLAPRLFGNGTKGDVLVVCDPWGDNEALCRALRVATKREIATIAITTDRPNLLAVLAHHSIRVPAIDPCCREFVIAALRHLVQTAAGSLVPAHRRLTAPPREIVFD